MEKISGGGLVVECSPPVRKAAGSDQRLKTGTHCLPAKHYAHTHKIIATKVARPPEYRFRSE